MTQLLSFENFGLKLPKGMHLVLTSDVCLTVNEGEIVGLVGESGSGKSLTARAALALYPHGSETSGRILFQGQDVTKMSAKEIAAHRGHGAAMIFQNPQTALDPVRTIGHFLTETMIAHDRLGRSAAEDRAVAAMEEVGLPSPRQLLARYPNELSGGMLQRVVICAAVLSGARLLLADEATTALDVTTQAEVIALLNRLRKTHGLGSLFITHDLELATSICDRIYVMYAGRIVEELPTERFASAAAHPYTRALLRARPSVDRKFERLAAIPGSPTTANEVDGACAFADRCGFVQDACRAGEPLLDPLGPRHAVRCIRHDKIVEQEGEARQ